MGCFIIIFFLVYTSLLLFFNYILYFLYLNIFVWPQYFYYHLYYYLNQLTILFVLYVNSISNFLL